VVQIRVTPKTRNPFTIKALLISGVTWKWHFLNHAVFAHTDEPAAAESRGPDSFAVAFFDALASIGAA